MSKWRPSPSGCVYIIPDIHGKYWELKAITNRILPLRRTNGIKDMIIFLGDYIDRGPSSYEVIQFLLEIKSEWGDQVVFLKGNHEDMLLSSISDNDYSNSFNHWYNNGGDRTINSYLENSNLNKKFSDFVISKDSVKKLFPQDHVDFLNSTKLYYELDDYFFCHSGEYINPKKEHQTDQIDDFLWGRNNYKNFIRFILNNKPYKLDKIIICGHNHIGPIIGENFIMLDAFANDVLPVMELNSVTLKYAKASKKKLYSLNMKQYKNCDNIVLLPPFINKTYVPTYLTSRFF